MIDLIASETRKIIFKCCEKYAKENNLDLSEVQLILGVNPQKEEPNTYKVCEKYVPKKELDIMGVLGVKIDFLGYSRLAPPFILKALVRFATTRKIDIDKVMVMCVPRKNEKNKPDVLLALYNGMEYVETITFEDLFSEEDFEMPT